jgi:hypothetical protein
MPEHDKAVQVEKIILSIKQLPKRPTQESVSPDLLRDNELFQNNRWEQALSEELRFRAFHRLFVSSLPPPPSHPSVWSS